MSGTDLARRLVAHPKWEWRAGMLTCNGRRILCPADVGTSGDDVGTIEHLGYGDYTWWGDGLDRECPDITDPATVGVLLAMADDAAGFPVDVRLEPPSGAGHPEHFVAESGSPDFGSGATRGEALADLLLILWGDA